MSPELIAGATVIAVGSLDGVLAGGGGKRRMAELKRPRITPPFGVWAAAQWLYYGLCCGAAYFLAKRSAQDLDTRIAVTLLLALIVCNACWNFMFFRKRDLESAWHASIAYAAVAIILTASFFPVDSGLAWLLCVFSAFVTYGSWWTHSVYRLNS